MHDVERSLLHGVESRHARTMGCTLARGHDEEIDSTLEYQAPRGGFFFLSKFINSESAAEIL